MASKAALKAAKAALDSQDYDQAIAQAQSVLAADAHNHFAKLFLGRAYEKKGQHDDAAKHYRSAAEAKPDDVQAWLGLCSVYEAQGTRRLDEYRDAAVRVVEIYGAQEDRDRCQNVFDKLVLCTKRQGSTQQVKRVLQLMLPASPVYDILEGRIQPPSLTFLRLAELTEAEEEQRIREAIAERRTRIGAKVGQVTQDVKREVFTTSDLEHLYQEVINWSNDDEVRRQYEEKLLQRAYDLLAVLPSGQKATKLDQVLTLAEGMVSIHHPFLLAWDLVLESRDLDDLRDLDAGIIREYVELFPASGTARIAKAWLHSELSPFPLPKIEEGDDKEAVEEIGPEDRLLLMTEGLQDAAESAFGHRLVAEYLLHLEEHQSAMETAQNGLKAVQSLTGVLGMGFQNTRDALNSVLATALVHHQAPRHHSEARDLFENILQRKPRFTPALIGLGLILEEVEDFPGAIKFLGQALEEAPGNLRIGTELAWCRAQNGEYDRAAKDLEDFLEQIRTDDPKSRDLRAQTLYRIGVCMWESDPSRSARKSRNGAYSKFLAAIKTNVNFAPAYTSLGFYYQDFAKDKKRARQCFQKAFELSPAEIGAAERLAMSFADQGDWDIVEVVAQRVVDSGRARPPPGSKKKGVSWPYSALGVVQMNKQEYQRAIVSFLAALRISPDDYQSYVGLGESYHNSGRYNSALRTFNYALDPHDGITMKVRGETWFARYMLANVYRELGDHDEAIDRLQSVLAERPEEFGVLLSLLQTFVERSYRAIETSVFGQAFLSAKDAIATARLITTKRPDAFNLWKAVGDACAAFTFLEGSSAKFPKDDVMALLNTAADEETFSTLADVDRVSMEALAATATGSAPSTGPSAAMLGAVLSYKRALRCASVDAHAHAVAWYNLGWAEQRTHLCVGPKSGKRFLRAAVRCFKRAIELEAGNAEFWNALGVATTTMNAKIAQHSFVRSLHLNELNAKVWANLGVLYLLQNDTELAHQAFTRAQSTDPDYAHAWVGEGLLSLLGGDSNEALNHFTHAFEISDAASIIVKKQYSVSSFDYLLAVSDGEHNDLTRLIQPIFALEQLSAQVPGALPYRHLAALLFERVGDHAAATESLAELCALAEAEYEKSESLQSLAQFAIAKSDLARNQLVLQDFAGAVENAETALDLSLDAELSGLDEDARRKLRLSAHLTAGLAQFHAGELQDSIAMFRSALVESANDADVVCSLVKVLWAQGGETERAVAHEQLLACVERFPDHVGAVSLLGAIAAVDNDVESMDAVASDLVVLQTKSDLKIQQREGIAALISSIAALTSSGDEEAENLSAAQRAIAVHPGQPQAWSQLAESSGETSVAEMALRTAAASVPPWGAMTTERLAGAFAGTGSFADGQRAAFLAPWASHGWRSMEEAAFA